MYQPNQVNLHIYVNLWQATTHFHFQTFYFCLKFALATCVCSIGYLPMKDHILDIYSFACVFVKLILGNTNFPLYFYATSTILIGYSIIQLIILLFLPIV